MTKIKEKIATLLTQLNHGLVDRDATLKSALLAILAGENILLIGPPGTAKSLIARRIAQSFTDGHQSHTNTYFEYLLTKFSTPEEIFGPLSISELKQDRFKRNTAGYLPSVKIAFLDEIFKANSSILNALLTIMNERVYHNGTNAEKVPLRALIAASNELPTGQEELSALYDRFLVRSFVGYVSEDKLQHLFELSEDKDIEDSLTHDDLKQLDGSISSITIPENIKQAVQDIWRKHKEVFKEDRREELSDRRLIKVIKLLRLSAVTNGRNEVDLSDVLLLKDCLWNHPDNTAKVQNLIIQTLRKYSSSVPLSEQDAPIVSATKVAPKRRVKGVIKGYTGCGTIDDPLLISNTDELLGLLRPDIGLKGYSFQQTKDIDCSAISSWSEIPFQGHYNGCYFTIKGRGSDEALFHEVKLESSITGVTLEGVSLAEQITGSKVSHCKSDLRLIRGSAELCEFAASESGEHFIGGNAKVTDFITCRAGQSLIGGDADECDIRQCQTGSILIDENGDTEGRSANKCKISDCIVVLDYQSSIYSTKKAGVAEEINNSYVTRCLVTGECGFNGGSYLSFSGFAVSLTDSQITACALGPMKRFSDGVTYKAGITEGIAALNNNASIDSVTIEARSNESNGKDGRTVAAAQFNQYFFEYTLDWDFESVWQWNEDTNLPSLQQIGIDADGISRCHDENVVSTVDLLTLQIKANIWL